MSRGMLLIAALIVAVAVCWTVSPWLGWLAYLAASIFTFEVVRRPGEDALRVVVSVAVAVTWPASVPASLLVLWMGRRRHGR